MTPVVSWFLLAFCAAVVQGNSVIGAASKEPVSAEIYDNLVFYAPFTRAEDVGASCPNPPHGAALQEYIYNPYTDTQAWLYRSDSRKEFILTFPGIVSLQDIITDLFIVPVPYSASGVKCPGCLVQWGILTAWNSATAEIERALTDALAEYQDYGVVLNGHRLGAALAELAFGSLADRKEFRIKKLYTYGAPRIGNQLFADYIDKLSGATEEDPGIYYRVTHADDNITQFLPNVVGHQLFVHPRTEYWEANDSSGKPSLETTYRCFGQESEDCNNSQKPAPGSDAHTTYAGMEFTCASS